MRRVQEERLFVVNRQCIELLKINYTTTYVVERCVPVVYYGYSEGIPVSYS